MYNCDIEYVSAPELSAYICRICEDQLIHEYVDACPSYNIDSITSSASARSFLPVGNNPYGVPADDSYYKQGSIVDLYTNSTRQEKFWLELVSNITSKNKNNLRLILTQLRNSTKTNSGLWLHTDVGCTPRVTGAGSDRKHLQVLVHLDATPVEAKSNDSTMLLFSQLSARDDNPTKIYNTWQHGYDLNILGDLHVGDNISVEAIGGMWSTENDYETFTLHKRVTPQVGTVIVLDYGQHYNVHAVAPKTVTRNRRIIEHWFEYT